MATIPPHYSDRFIIQRYNKALQFVQKLPATSNFQPTKNQKLQLYALYKQVSEGDVNTQRPGLFDVVGRAKWDAWKKLEGLSVLEARHIYVESLLKIAAEAYKKNMGREEAQKIIHTFANMRPSGDDDESEDLSDTTSNQEDDTSVGSEDAEEQAYLRDIEESNLVVPSPEPPRHTLGLIRPNSSASVQTVMTAPNTPRQHPIARPSSSSSFRTTRLIASNERRINQLTDYVDPNINPWQPASSDDEQDIRIPRQRSSLKSPMRRLQRIASPTSVPTMTPIYPSPIPGSSTSSSVTATPHRPNSRLAAEHYTVALGPATKRALESLQQEVIALNDRIDDLRKELVERDRQRIVRSNEESSDESTIDEIGDNWRWVIKAALRYAGINLLTAIILFLILYKNGSPIAFVILRQSSKFWQSIKLRIQISNVVV